MRPGGPPGLGIAPWTTYQQVTQISCWTSPSWILLSRPRSSALGELLREKEEVIFRKCLVLCENKWQEMPLNPPPPPFFYELQLQNN